MNQIRDVQSLLSKNMNQNREVHRLGGGGGGGGGGGIDNSHND